MKNILKSIMMVMIVAASSCQDDPEVSPIETGTVTDIQGNEYPTAKIGDQWWMTANLRTVRFNNGDPIQTVIASDSASWVSWQRPLCCKYQDMAQTPGMLYNAACISDSRGIAPAGWHVATDEDWKKLEQTIGMASSAVSKCGWRGSSEGDAIKKTGLNSWARYDGVWATDKYLFGAEAGGCRLFDARFSFPSGLTYGGFWWTSSAASSGSYYYRYLDYKSSGIFRSFTYASYGMSVRCVKD